MSPSRAVSTWAQMVPVAVVYQVCRRVSQTGARVTMTVRVEGR